MKKYLNYISRTILAGTVLFFASCEDGDQVFDQIQSNVERGAVLRTVDLTSNELPIGKADARFAATLEAQTQEEGDNVSQIEVYVGFRDNTVEEGAEDKDVAEALFSTIPSSEFYTGEFGYPRVDVSVALSEMLNFTGVAEEDLFGGDQFEVRFELVLDDGRRFSFADNSGTLTGSFFSSPFLYTPTVVCPVESDMFVGQYMIEQVTPGIFASNTWGDGTIVELSIGETSTQRVFSAVYLPDFGIGNGPREFKFDLVCETVLVPGGQASGLQCSGGILFGPPQDNPVGLYDKDDDTTFTIVFRDDETDDCGGGVDAEVRLTKV